MTRSKSMEDLTWREIGLWGKGWPKREISLMVRFQFGLMDGEGERKRSNLERLGLRGRLD